MKGFAVLRAQISMADAKKEEKMRGSVSVFIAGVIGLIMVPIINPRVRVFFLITLLDNIISKINSVKIG